jgi:hypothetical protein
MDTNDILTLVGTLSTATIAIVTILIQGKRMRDQSAREKEILTEHQDFETVERERSEQLHQEQIKAQQKRHNEQLQREDELRLLNRKDQAHIEFDIDCNGFTPVDDLRLLEVVLSAHNKGNTLQLFKEIKLRVRGIKHGESLAINEKINRADFSHSILDDTNIIPDSVNFFFVEPNVNQRFQFSTVLAQEYKYICIRAAFHYDKSTIHTTERIFEL